MNSMQRDRIERIRQHFVVKFDDAFVKMHTMRSTGASSPAQIENAIQLSFAQGVLKAVELILRELE